MGTDNQSKPIFRNAFPGYNKADVDDYIARLESEMEIVEKRQEKWESQVTDLNGEIERLNHTVDRERTDRVEFQDKNVELEQKVVELERRIENLKKEKEDQENQKSPKETEDNFEVDPKTIQDAILNAQRMGEIIIAEANQKAEEIKNQAEMFQQEQERNAKQIIEDAKKEAYKIIGTTQVKLENLQRDYNSALLDVSKFKAELLDMYQKHIKLLDSLPEINTPKIAYIDAEDISEPQENEKNV